MRGIMFRPWKIKAIAANPDKEWQTRRVIKPQPSERVLTITIAKGGYYEDTASGRVHVFQNPRYHVGEAVYIKEAIRRKRNDPAMPCDYITYVLDDTGVFPLNPSEKYPQFGRPSWAWKGDSLSPLFMPAWAARYFIKILDVQACRTKDINFQDCLAEGIFEADGCYWYPINLMAFATPQAAYFALYDSINGKGAHERNWDWRYIFERR